MQILFRDKSLGVKRTGDLNEALIVHQANSSSGLAMIVSPGSETTFNFLGVTFDIGRPSPF